MSLAGGCLCSAIRYECVAAPGDVADYCHCQQCRTASGAPVVAWIQVSPDRFRLTCGTPKNFASSAHATRWFCGDCGSQLYMTDAENRSVGVTIASLDQPDAVQPKVHGWNRERITWFNTADALPRYSESPPYDL